MRLVAYTLGLALVTTAAACSRPAPAAEPPPPARAVQVAPAELRARLVGEEIVGTVRARHSATLAPTVTGTVRDVHVTLGSRVRKGDVLVRLSAREIDARLDQARAVWAHARLERDRALTLQQANAIPRAAVDNALSQFRVAEAAADEAGTMAAHTVLRAPFDGVVTSKSVSVGDTAMPGQPLLIVEQPDELRFEAPVPEASAQALPSGRRVEVRFDTIAAPVVGTVAEISPTADPASRTVTVKLDLPRVDQLHAGIFGRMILPAEEARAIAVPSSGLIHRGQLDEVFVVEGGVAHLRLVKTGRAHDGMVELVSGVDPGERVVVSDAAQLVDGQAVRGLP